VARVPYILPAAVVAGLGAALSPPLLAQSRALLPSGGIIGRVIDQQSQLPLGGATVSLLGMHLQTATDSGGRFTHGGLGPGTYLIEVRAIGYGVSSWILKLKDGEVVDYTFEIAPLGVELDPVTVEGRPAYAERRLREFEERRRGGGPAGVVVGELEHQGERIQRRAVLVAVDRRAGLHRGDVVDAGSSGCRHRWHRDLPQSR